MSENFVKGRLEYTGDKPHSRYSTPAFFAFSSGASRISTKILVKLIKFNLIKNTSSHQRMALSVCSINKLFTKKSKSDTIFPSQFTFGKEIYKLTWKLFLKFLIFLLIFNRSLQILLERRNKIIYKGSKLDSTLQPIPYMVLLRLVECIFFQTIYID